MKPVTTVLWSILAVTAISCVTDTAGAQQTDAQAQTSASAAQGPLQTGMQLYLRGKYDEAQKDFEAAIQQNPGDHLAKLWDGIAQIASGDHSRGQNTLSSATDTIGPWSDARHELSALGWWRHGETNIAKSELGFCENTPLCQKMNQGLDSGASAPDPKDWPSITGLIQKTTARTTVWHP